MDKQKQQAKCIIQVGVSNYLCLCIIHSLERNNLNMFFYSCAFLEGLKLEKYASFDL